MIYEDRIVAFIDILGFKNIVNKSLENKDYQEKIEAILKYLLELQNESYNESLSTVSTSKEVSVFSDSVIISYPYNSENDDSLHNILINLIYISGTLCDHGFFIRGGLAFGKLYHKRNICFGQALIDAYQIESKKAKYPRILIEKNVLNKLPENLDLDPELRINACEIDKNDVNELIKEDKDGEFYLDFLRVSKDEMDNAEDYFNFLGNIKKFTEDNLSHSKDEFNEFIVKYIWFANYYNETIDDIIKNTKNNNYFFEIPKKITY